MKNLTLTNNWPLNGNPAAFSIQLSLSSILERKKFLEKLLTETEKRITHSPEGTLRINCIKNHVQYFHRTYLSADNGVYIPKKQIALARQLAQKDYDLKLRKSVIRELKAINYYLKTIPDMPSEEVYYGLSEKRQPLVIPPIETDRTFLEKWTSFQYQGKPFKENAPVFYTDRNERVRSKSELIIANLLTKENVPYRSECPIRLMGSETVYPDFTVLNKRLRKEYIWEHFGMMDDPEYAEKAVRKINLYQRNGYFPGENLILTYETSVTPVNTQDLKRIIEYYLQ